MFIKPGTNCPSETHPLFANPEGDGPFGGYLGTNPFGLPGTGAKHSLAIWPGLPHLKQATACEPLVRALLGNCVLCYETLPSCLCCV